MVSLLLMQFEIDFPSEVKEWELSHDDLTIQRHLGSGQYGRVLSAILSTTTTSQRANYYIQSMRLMGGCRVPQLVAVKQLKGELHLQLYPNNVEKMV